MNTTQYYMSE